MLSAILLASGLSCVPLPTCGIPPVSPCATPTPTISWDQITNADLAGYDVYEREPGAPFQFLVRLPCEWNDLDMNGTAESRFCRGPDLGAALQRYCPWCAPYTLHEFAVIAYDTAGNQSQNFSNVLSVCFSPICARPGPCN